MFDMVVVVVRSSRQMFGGADEAEAGSSFPGCPLASEPTVGHVGLART